MNLTLLLSMPGGTEWILIAFALALLVFWIKLIIEIANGQFTDPNMKIVWLLIVICLGVLGAAIYLLAGRQNLIKNNSGY